MKDLLYKKMKAPPKSSSKPKTSKTSKTTSSKKGKSTSSTTADEEPAPARFTINPGEDLPTEEEILRMVSEAQAKQSSSSSHIIDEL